jgi:hypothetical protein
MPSGRQPTTEPICAICGLADERRLYAVSLLRAFRVKAPGGRSFGGRRVQTGRTLPLRICVACTAELIVRHRRWEAGRQKATRTPICTP